ncbi:hypothetical protein C8Q79DRAFT_1006221 [Trametes meyenii]|nr:hypothetical protein C8Q79DRAFT_1006221 [Trametes meyenii]
MFYATKTAALLLVCYLAALAAANPAPVPSPPTGKAAAAPTPDMCKGPSDCK